MIDDLTFVATLAASDMERARRWYAESLGLEPAEEIDDGPCWFRAGSTQLMLYPSEFAGTNQATGATLATSDMDAAMERMRAAGVTFEEYEFEGGGTVDGVVTTPDGDRVAWFRDSEGNILSLVSTRRTM